MKPATAKIWLQRMLYFVAIILLMAVVPIFFPESLMDWMHQKLGLGELSDQPITSYLTRSTSMLYAVHGAVMLRTAMKIENLFKIVPLLAWLHVAIGLVLLGIDWNAQMPWWWTLGEGPSIAAGGLLMVWLCHQARPEFQTTSG